VREIRQHGSAGGGPEPNRASLPRLWSGRCGASGGGLHGSSEIPSRERGDDAVHSQADGWALRGHAPNGAGGRRDASPPGFRRGLCDCKCIEPAGCESLSVAGLAAVTEWNCVPVRECGEHQEVNDRSVG
jgi:hypothetical protein